ncbi:(R)-mandelonitrile lyase [Yersinia aleksiciae]|nr:cupin domain-containing protein [Yersinia aleksiciae]MDA5498583.1 cupin domain-containing protein [Yersinia aleksiciae]NIL01295.1 cupin domain-containing protein [Yersinia aleksiciae]WQC71238.1 cupin domain-containing protein [Yersinia aleksiciae]
MKILAASTVMLSMLSPAAFAAVEEKVKITPSGSQPSRSGPENYFSGQVRIDAPFQATPPARVGGATVTFEPKARTAWHTHPLGQTLIITQGRGWIQEWGSEIKEMNQGDIVWIPEGVKHWHGATPDTAMTHIAIAESLNGSPVEWMEKVSDEQYQK